MRAPAPWPLPTQPMTRAELHGIGISDRMLRTRLRMGELIQPRHGVYLRAASWPPDEAGRHLMRARAEQAANPRAVLSHGSAALALGLPSPGFTRWEQGRVTVTLPAAGHSSRATHVVHRTGSLPTGQVQRDADGYPVTTPARTAVDLAADLPLPESLVLLDAAGRLIIDSMVPQARRRDYANPRLIQAAVQLLKQSATTVRAGSLAEHMALADPRRESAAESLSAGYLSLADLPLPACQAEIRTPGGSLFPDFLWEEQRLIGEVDGAVKYLSAQAYVLEKEREQALRDAGYGIVRWLAKEIMLDPAAVMARIARALAL